MNVIARFRGWLRQRRRIRAARKLKASLREFVYLDEVSVFSLVASRLGPVAAEFTDTETNSLKNEQQGVASATMGVFKGEEKSRRESTTTRSSQVLRKATVQATFKELYELEEENLALRPFKPDLRPPRVRSIEEIRAGFGEPAFDGWLIGAAEWRRGQLLEMEVELAADPTFRMSSILTFFVDMIGENPELFPSSMLGQLQKPMAVNRILDWMLVGLIPIRGKATDYKAIRILDEPALVHNDLLSQIGDLAAVDAQDAYIVGVTEQRLYWKDIRQVLYSDSRYRMLCRIAHPELSDSWKPVKGVDILGGLTPNLSGSLADFGNRALQVLSDSQQIAEPDINKASCMEKALLDYARIAAEGAEAHLPGTVLSQVEKVAKDNRECYADHAGRRDAFNAILRILESEAGLSMTADKAASLRTVALAGAGLTLDGNLVSPSTMVEPDVSAGGLFLETEVIAIYW